MIGNDIIDLNLARQESNWRRPRFLQKIFTPFEIDCITNAEDTCAAVWQLWCMKEAAYKLYMKQNPKRFYNPKAFECSGCDLFGTVTYRSFKVKVKSLVLRDYIFAEAYEAETPKSVKKIIPLQSSSYAFQSLTIKKELFKNLSAILGLIENGFEIQKSPYGIPKVFHKNHSIDLDLSLTHHGHFAAYSIVS